MKRYIKSSYTWEPKFEGTWSEEEIALWRSIDWKARNWEEYVVKDDTFKGTVVIYGMEGGAKYIDTTFVKYIRPNPIFPPYYGPIDEDIANKEFPGNHIVGPMYDGRKKSNYMIMDRYETQRLYDMLSD